MNWYIEAMSKYAQFSGRARRKEFWMFLLVNYGISFGIGFFSGMFKINPIISIVYSFASFIPSLAVTVRRLHDTSHSGWWAMVPFYNMYLYCIPGEVNGNQYGPDPKAPESSTQNVLQKVA